MDELMLNPDKLAIVVIDVQPGFLDGWMAGPSEPVLARLELLFGLATVYDLPLLATFELGFMRAETHMRINKGVFVIVLFATFLDGSGRASYLNREFFYRET